MRFALVDDERMEARKGLQGICPVCLQPVITKCGDKKVHHWAHATNLSCETWWEPETEWHRKWKDFFPKECQEIIKLNEVSGEKHIADVCTNDGIFIEFQHSHITLQERESRERFYNKMFWVVDGTRLKNDYPRFIQAFKKRMIYPAGKELHFFINYINECFPQDWINSSVPVVFDFKGLMKNENNDAIREFLWCLLPKDKMRNEYIRNGYLVTEIRRNLLVGITREDFINNLNYFYNYLQS